MDNKLTIVIPAYNEEARLEVTVREALACAQESLAAFEIIIVNDGSADRTRAVADGLAREFSSVIEAVHFPANRGVGAAYAEGLERARYPFLTLIPGDNAFNKTGVARVFSEVGTSELIVSYRTNPQARTPLRRSLSMFATFLMQRLTGHRIRDAHSLFVFPVRLARQIRVPDDYCYHLESLCRLLLMTGSYREVPVDLNPKPDASSGVMKPRTIFRLGVTIVKLYGLRLVGRLVRSA